MIDIEKALRKLPKSTVENKIGWDTKCKFHHKTGHYELYTNGQLVLKGPKEFILEEVENTVHV